MIEIDADWLRDHPLPAPAPDADKNDRGRVLVMGGSRFVPGALRLTGEAALRAGAGKVQLATINELALPLGMMIPEAAIIALASDAKGEIDGAAASDSLVDPAGACDALVLGPGMGKMAEGARLVGSLLHALGQGGAAVLDAAAIGACAACRDAVRSLAGRAVLTPHLGEMAELTGRDIDWIADHMEEVTARAAAELKAVVVLKSARTVIASPDGAALVFEGGGPGLATGGSGDVLAGILGGLLSRGVDPMTASAWAVWVHGEAGRTITARLGGPGLLARELLALVPGLLHPNAEEGSETWKV
jgi:ADP-dependent NAD(P)H-hydrate dehydratase